MSEPTIEIIETTNSISIETNIATNNNIEIELVSPSNVEIINSINIPLVGDLPQGYPLDWTVGNLPISRLSGLIGTSGINYSSGIISLSGIPTNLLPVQNLLAGSGIDIANNQGIFTVAVTGQFGLTGEQVDDRVSSLLVSGNYTTLNYDDENNKLTISVTGLQPSGNYSLQGHQHSISDVSGLQLALDSKQPSGNYANSVHSHISSEITDFSSSVDSRITLANLQPSGNYSIVGHFHIIGDVTGLQIALDSKQPSGVYASGIHSHTTSDITNFSTSISGLLPSISGSEYVSSNFSNNTYTISVSGLQPSGNYSINGHTHSSNDITNFNSEVNSLVSGIYAPLNSPNFSGVPTVPTASSGTNNTQAASTAFVRNEISSLVNSAPSTLDTLNELASALGNDPNFATTIASGLGQKANLVHNHIASNISDFNSSVSGLLPVKNILGGTNVSITTNSGIYTVAVTGQLGLSSEQVDDRVNDLLKAGSYISLSYDDNNNSLTISSTGLQPSGDYSLVGHTHISANITDFNSATSGLINSSLSTSISGGAGIDVSYYSNTDTLLISTSGVSLLGHQHTYSEITDFNTGVRLNRINDLTIPSGNVSFNNYLLTNLATPTSGTDAVNKNYIDTLYASTSGLGIASFSSNDFSVVSGAVTIKHSGVDNNQLAFSYITLGSSTINLGSSITNVQGLILDGGTP
jgi:hypothetical protein